MRLFSQFVLRTAQTLAFLLLAFTLARPVSSQTMALGDTIQAIAQQQKVISETYKLERSGVWVMHLETLALLAAYGDWTRGDPGKRRENLELIKYMSRLKPELVHGMTAVQRNKSVSDDELKRFSDMHRNVEALCAAAMEVHHLLEEGKVDEAGAIYRDKSIPLIQSINADSFTLTSGLEQKMAKAALQARLAK